MSIGSALPEGTVAPEAEPADCSLETGVVSGPDFESVAAPPAVETVAVAAAGWASGSLATGVVSGCGNVRAATASEECG